jgi:hypothetical protein
MSPDAIFKICNTVALASWIVLLAAPFAPRLVDRVAGLAVPLLLSIVYAGLVMAFWSRAEGGFGSLPDVMRLFTSREIALAGWVHYLAFDLFVGAWEVRTAREERIWFAAVVPCLVLTFLFGPVGFLAFSCLRAARRLSPITSAQ